MLRRTGRASFGPSTFAVSQAVNRASPRHCRLPRRENGRGPMPLEIEHGGHQWERVAQRHIAAVSEYLLVLDLGGNYPISNAEME